MKTFLTGDIWEKVKRHARGARHRCAAIAYVTKDFPFKEGDIVVCDASERAVTSGQTSAKILEEWHARGVRLFSRPELHAKTIVMGRTALIGSANLSESSASHLIEAGVIVREMGTVDQARSFVLGLTESSKEIDESVIAAISSLKVERPSGRLSTKAHAKRPRIADVRYWIVGVRPVSERIESRLEARIEKAERERSTVRGSKCRGRLLQGPTSGFASPDRARSRRGAEWGTSSS